MSRQRAAARRTTAAQRAARRPHRRASGATLVETAIVLPVAVLLVLVIVQTGALLLARQVLDRAAFEGARRGAVAQAREAPIRRAVVAFLGPLYQDATDPDDAARLSGGLLRATADLAVGARGVLTIERLSPSPAAFDDFGVARGPDGRRVLPNDHLDLRPARIGAASGRTLQQANLLTVRVTFGYPLGVPLMRTLMPEIMCAAGLFGLADVADCTRYWRQGRAPLVVHASAYMQSDAEADWP